MIGVQLPGRENRLREPVNSNLCDVLNGIVDSLAPVLTEDIPFVFFGHSLGALLAFEVARKCRVEKLVTPAALIVSGRTPPHFPLLRPALHRLTDDDLLREVARLDGIPQEIQSHSEMRRLVLPPLRADLILDETYTYSPGPPLDCPILACGARNDLEAPLPAMQEWESCTRSSFVFRTFEGGHFFIHTSGALFISEVASFLQNVLHAQS